MKSLIAAAAITLLACGAHAQEPAKPDGQAPQAQPAAPAPAPLPQKYAVAVRAAIKPLALLLERGGEVPQQKLDALAPELDKLAAAVKDTLGPAILADAARKEDLARAEAAKKALQDFRAALQVYYVQNGGKYPKTPADLVPAALPAVPELELPGHARTAAVTVIDSKKYDKDIAGAVTDSGGWLYFSNPASANYGLLVLDCRHAEPDGGEFYRY
jgi:hypothetical protein